MIPRGWVGSTQYNTFAIYVDNCTHEKLWKLVGYLCLEDLGPDNPALNTHVYIFPDCRTHHVIKEFVKNIRPTLSGYLQGRNKTRLLAGCDFADDKMKRFLILLGFIPEPVWVGSLDFTSDVT